jgi:hypothetical protein
VCHESGFLGKCTGRRHPGFGCRRLAVEFQDSLRRLNCMSWSKQDLVLNEAFDRNPFRGGGSLRFPFPRHVDTNQSRWPRIPRAARLRQNRCRNDSRSPQRRARPLKVVDGESGADQNVRVHQHSKRVLFVGLRLLAPSCCKAFWLEHAFQLLSCHRGARHSGRGGGLRALSARQSDPVSAAAA